MDGGGRGERGKVWESLRGKEGRETGWDVKTLKIRLKKKFMYYIYHIFLLLFEFLVQLRQDCTTLHVVK